MDEKDADTLVEMLSIIYCRAICREFRQPVELLYPSLSKSYLAKIPFPMDLGTLLLAAMKRKMHIYNYRDGLRLVFSNAIDYNNDSDLMINISKHLDRFAAGLYEEAFHEPYRANILITAFAGHRINNRLKLFTLLKNEKLKLSEVKSFEESLKQVFLACHTDHYLKGEPLPPKLFIEALDACRKVTFDALDVYASSKGTIVPTVSIEDVMKPLLVYFTELVHNHGLSEEEFSPELFRVAGGGHDKRLPLWFVLLYRPGAVPASSSSSSQSQSQSQSESELSGVDATLPKAESFMQANKSWCQSLHLLDGVLGHLTVLVYERVHRGCLLSVVWATPRACVINNDSGRLAIKLTLPVGAGFPSQVCLENLHRLPAAVLNRLRERLPSTSAEAVNKTEGFSSSYTFPTALPVTPPPGQVLLEYLDTHEFGWAVQDQLNEVSYQALQDPSSLGIPSTCPADVLTKCVKVAAWLENHTTRFLDNVQYRPQGSSPRGSTESSSAQVGEDSKADLDVSAPTLRQLEKTLHRWQPSQNPQDGSDVGAFSETSVPEPVTAPVPPPKAQPAKRAYKKQHHPPPKPVPISHQEPVEGPPEPQPVADLTSLYLNGVFLASECRLLGRRGRTSKKARALHCTRIFGSWLADQHRQLQPAIPGTSIHYPHNDYPFITVPLHHLARSRSRD